MCDRFIKLKAKSKLDKPIARDYLFFTSLVSFLIVLISLKRYR